jgi:integrase-like protein
VLELKRGNLAVAGDRVASFDWELDPFQFVFDRGCFHTFDEDNERAQFAQNVAAGLVDGIEAWWRSLKHQWLFLHSLDSVATVRRLIEFYVQEHNRVLPHSAFRGQTPDELYFGTGDAIAADLAARVAAARQARVEANRSAACGTCPSADAAA